MSVETLREAARLMRERARAATQTPWGTVTHDFGMANLTINGCSTFRCPDCGTNAETDEQNAVHIASWHPAVAFEVAHLLEFEASIREQNRKPWRIAIRAFVPENPAILAVARAYVGEPS